jgi:hypothetical protein
MSSKGGLQSFKWARNPTSTRKQKLKSKNNKETTTKSENNKTTKTMSLGEIFYISRSDDLCNDIVATIRKTFSANSCKIFSPFELLFRSSTIKPPIGPRLISLVHKNICYAIHVICLGQIIM